MAALIWRSAEAPRGPPPDLLISQEATPLLAIAKAAARQNLTAYSKNDIFIGQPKIKHLRPHYR
jgi:hypothetical protein